MKKILFRSLLVIGLATAVVSCNDDDDNTGGGSSSSIVGVWDQLTDFYTVTSGGVVLDSDTSTYAPGEQVIDFRSNGIVITTDTSGSDTSNYTYSGNTLTIVTDDLGNLDTLVFNTSISGNNGTFTNTSTESVGGVTFTYVFGITVRKR